MKRTRAKTFLTDTFGTTSFFAIRLLCAWAMGGVHVNSTSHTHRACTQKTKSKSQRMTKLKSFHLKKSPPGLYHLQTSCSGPVYTSIVRILNGDNKYAPSCKGGKSAFPISVNWATITADTDMHCQIILEPGHYLQLNIIKYGAVNTKALCVNGKS